MAILKFFKKGAYNNQSLEKGNIKHLDVHGICCDSTLKVSSHYAKSSAEFDVPI